MNISKGNLLKWKAGHSYYLISEIRRYKLIEINSPIIVSLLQKMGSKYLVSGSMFLEDLISDIDCGRCDIVS